MKFYADLHVHSKFARATSKDCTLEALAEFAAIKGIKVVATGDFTHPAWFDEIKTKLIEAEPGLFKLRPEFEKEISSRFAPGGRFGTRFILEVEVATISQYQGKTRKVHHCIYMPDFQSAQRLQMRLSKIGNLGADGRPILGLNPKDLVEIVLECGEEAFVIPAHIWTPWFSILGSNSGYDSIEECYQDMSKYIFAVETGLSSDPPMNWRVSFLDKYRLVSNSDAHSPSKLGREACIFNCELNYYSLKKALQTGEGYLGTIEFFPEEGKYHLDGHRACGTRLEPEQTKRLKGRCPKCGQPVTIGVLHRVEELADRPIGAQPASATHYKSLVPLEEILAEILESNPGTKKVIQEYLVITNKLGPELEILQEVSIDEIERCGGYLLAEAIRRIRAGEVWKEAGFDGQYGTIRVFCEGEVARLKHQWLLISHAPTLVTSKEESLFQKKDLSSVSQQIPLINDQFKWREETGFELDIYQQQAVLTQEGPVIVIAGPGSGKTRVLASKIAHMIKDGYVLPSQCLAVTFTRKAACELQQRLQKFVGPEADEVECSTIHAWCYRLLKRHGSILGLKEGWNVCSEQRLASILKQAKLDTNQIYQKLRSLTSWVGKACSLESLPEQLAQLNQFFIESGHLGYYALVPLALQLLQKDPQLLQLYQQKYRLIAVDEFQDVDPLQANLIKLLASQGKGLFVIGDPDQSIYSFRGADPQLILQLQQEFSNSKRIILVHNYRSCKSIVESAMEVIKDVSLVKERKLIPIISSTPPITVVSAPDEYSEAKWIAEKIEELVGGLQMERINGRRDLQLKSAVVFKDIAILVRTEAQMPPIANILRDKGIPFATYRATSVVENPLLQKLLELAQQTKDLTPVFTRLQHAAVKLKQDSSYQQELRRFYYLVDNLIAALFPIAEAYGSDWNKFVEELSLMTELDLWDEQADMVHILTLHASKGLEYEVVFIAGCEDGLIPFTFYKEKSNLELAEEQRLFFVGMTRAKKMLFCSWCRQRFIDGKPFTQKRSPYLDLIPPHYTHNIILEKQIQERQLWLF